MILVPSRESCDAGFALKILQIRPDKVDDAMICCNIMICGTRQAGSTKSPSPAANRCPWLIQPEMAKLGAKAEVTISARQGGSGLRVQKWLDPYPHIIEAGEDCCWFGLRFWEEKEDDDWLPISLRLRFEWLNGGVHMESGFWWGNEKILAFGCGATIMGRRKWVMETNLVQRTSRIRNQWETYARRK
jgi:hypothetical protein